MYPRVINFCLDYMKYKPRTKKCIIVRSTRHRERKPINRINCFLKQPRKENDAHLFFKAQYGDKKKGIAF